ncbi:MAG: proton extrusion protein PcxA [Synechococcaceae cyanobacterium]|nr:proton extrusion protein PcxA [Synechococcaceae cyanobacterium]
MGISNWISAFGRSRSLDLSNDLERGYESALLIQSLEMEYYNDRPVRPELELRIPKAMQAQVLRRFRTALQICRESQQNLESYRHELAGQEIRQLQLIESVTRRYDQQSQPLPRISRSPDVLPRSLLTVVDQVRQQLDPDAEQNVVQGFRRRRDSTLVSLRILLLLILVPVMVQQISRNYIVAPLIDRLAPQISILNYPKPKLERRAIEELRSYRAQLEFESLVNNKHLLPEPELERQLMLKAQELKQESERGSNEAIKNVAADIFALLGFSFVCLIGQRDLQVLRGFLDELIYGLSDSAKAFAIILFTDIFVGFHSPEGWTVLLDGVTHHLGLPADENFIMLFIATFPVVLATILKYWIFRYLNRVSPSSVATLRNMNGGG